MKSVKKQLQVKRVILTQASCNHQKQPLRDDVRNGCFFSNFRVLQSERDVPVVRETFRGGENGYSFLTNLTG